MKTLSFLVLFFSLSLIIPVSVSAASTYYVSKSGNNEDGQSWQSAWNELNQINWNIIQQGDTIVLDGGTTACSYPVKITNIANTPSPNNCGMLYSSTLNIAKSGTSSNPITIKVSTDTGHNGTVRIFGGRTYPVPYLHQTDHPGNPSGTRSYGISVDQNTSNNNGWVTIDGSHWAGIMVYGHSSVGVTFEQTNCGSNLPTGVTIRNLEIFDNGSRGIRPAGTDILFDNVMVHDNGQDSFQVDSITTNMTIRRSWLFNSRPNPQSPECPFNQADQDTGSSHSDGVQIYAGNGAHTGFKVEDSIIGPGHMHTFMLGDYNASNSCIGTTTVPGFTVKNSLLISDHCWASEDTVHTKSNDSVVQNNYVFDNISSIRDNNQRVQNIYHTRGTGHTVTDSLFVGGTTLTMSGSSTISNNFCSAIADRYNICSNDTQNPSFRDPVFDGVWDDPLSADSSFAEFDFTITNPAIPSGVGSSITSVATLLGKSSTPPPSSAPTYNTSDLEPDGDVDTEDFLTLVSNFGLTGILGWIRSDIVKNGAIDIFDFNKLISNFGL